MGTQQRIDEPVKCSTMNSKP